MSKTCTIDKISKLFSIPKSTLRYWESEGLISSIRNDENDYREYSTDNLLEICDIKFYRSLNLPIRRLKNILQMGIDDNEDLLKESQTEIQNKIEDLNKTLNKINYSLEKIQLFRELQERPYSISTPKFNKIVHLRLSETENVLEYIQNQHVLSFVTDFTKCSINYYGTISVNSPDTSKKALWENDNTPHTYITCLLPVKDDIIDKLTLDKHLDYIHSINSKPGIILAQYLASDYPYDYFQAWIEII
ncbi:MerR family transcriptional regulator [Clostridium sp. MB05]|uniref:MerR family transcriptional regulator n=4 Tax=Clostridium TaxID=1485 RepID=UPI003981EDC4